MIRLDIAYDGRNFFGSQKQKNERTVQGEVERVLEILYQTPIRLHLSGRTDAGVHARKQVCHYENSLDIPIDRLHYALNSLLPTDIQLLQVIPAEDNFHARYSAKGKTYQYILTSSDDVFQRSYKLYLKEALNLDAIDEAIQQLIGTHDFYSFSNLRPGEHSTVRTISEISYEWSGKDLVFTFRGNGFLYKMVRILMQYLIHVGVGKLNPKETKRILESHSREYTRRVAPPQGLYLVDIEY